MSDSVMQIHQTFWQEHEYIDLLIMTSFVKKHCGSSLSSWLKAGSHVQHKHKHKHKKKYVWTGAMQAQA